MFYKIKVFNFALLILQFTLISFLSATAPDTLWTKTYGGTGDEYGNCVQQTEDGGFIISGVTMFLKPFQYIYVYLIRTNSNGDTLWTKTYGRDSISTGSSVQQTSDGGFIVTGYTSSYSPGTEGTEDVYLIRTDSIGDTLWTKTFGGDTTDRGSSVLQTNDGGFVIVGTTYSFGDTLDDIYLIRTNLNGDTLWTKTYGGNRHERGYSIQQDGDSGFVIAGNSSSFGAGGYDVYLIHINSNGDTLWTKTYGGGLNDYCSSVQRTNDEGYVIVGVTYSFGPGISDVYLIRTDSIGDTLWTKTYCKNSKTDNLGSETIQTSEGGFIITGSTTPGPNVGNEVYLIRTDTNGDTLWTRTFGCDSSDVGISIQQTDDGGYILVGSTSSFGAGGSDVYLIRLDKDTTAIQQEIPFNLIKPKNLIVNYNNGNISILYTISYSTYVKLEAYDIKGKLVKVITDKFMQKGSYSVNWDSKRFGAQVPCSIKQG